MKLALAAVAVLEVGCATAPLAAPPKGPPPALSFSSINHQGSVTLGGRVTVITVCASWADACRPTFAELHKLYQRHHEHGVLVLGLLVDDLPKDPAVKNQIRQVIGGVEFPVALDVNGGADFEVHSIPETVVLDPQRNVRFRHTGREPGWAEAIEDEVRALLVEPPAR